MANGDTDRLIQWEKRAHGDAQRLFAAVRQRREKQLAVRVRCPGCNGAGLLAFTAGSGSDAKLCLVCAGVGMAAYDWTRSDSPRPLRDDELRPKEAERPGDQWQERADDEAKRLFAEVRQRGEKYLGVRVRCPGCRGAVWTAPARRCSVCAGIGMVAYDWTRSEQPRPLRSTERRREETERAEKAAASLPGSTSRLASK